VKHPDGHVFRISQPVQHHYHDIHNHCSARIGVTLETLPRAGSATQRDRPAFGNVMRFVGRELQIVRASPRSWPLPWTLVFIVSALRQYRRGRRVANSSLPRTTALLDGATAVSASITYSAVEWSLHSADVLVVVLPTLP
jgi:hypothetical protein